jgi:hypothetical protein
MISVSHMLWSQYLTGYDLNISHAMISISQGYYLNISQGIILISHKLWSQYLTGYNLNISGYDLNISQALISVSHRLWYQYVTGYDRNISQAMISMKPLITISCTDNFIYFRWCSLCPQLQTAGTQPAEAKATQYDFANTAAIRRDGRAVKGVISNNTAVRWAAGSFGISKPKLSCHLLKFQDKEPHPLSILSTQSKITLRKCSAPHRNLNRLIDWLIVWLVDCLNQAAKSH